MTTGRGDGPDYDPATVPKRPDASLGELFTEMTAEMGTLFRKEVELAKAETKTELKKTGQAAGMFGAAGLGAWMALLFISLAAAWLLDQAINRALAFLIVGVVWAIIAAVLLSIGKKRMKQIEPLPETRDTLKEDVAWAKAQTN